MNKRVDTNTNPTGPRPALRRPRWLFSFILSALGVPWLSAHAQNLSSGGAYVDTILLNQTNSYTFSATNGDRVVVRIGTLTTTNYFNPWLRIYNPNGVLIGDGGGSGTADSQELALMATNNGTFTVLVSDGGYVSYGGTGQYRLCFGQFPGTFTVPVGDEGGSMSNGGSYDGTIQSGDLDFWSFTANPGDRIVVRIGTRTTTNYFNPWLRIYDPNGVLIADSGAASTQDSQELTLTAATGGAFTVLVSDGSYVGYGGTGAYRVYFAQFPGTFIVPVGDEGGSMSSGGSYDGTIQIGDLDFWSFTANPGDRVVVRIGTLTATNYFNPWLRIYDPNGVLIADSGGASTEDAQELALTATNGGTFTVLVSDGSYVGYGGTGAYRVYFAQFPGTFIVPASDEGGSMSSGGSYDGTIQIGDLDFWSFTANSGDRIVVRVGTLTTASYFNPWLRIYDPNGVLIADSGGASTQDSQELTLTAGTGGTFTVLVSDGSYVGYGGTGTYRLYFAQFPGTFIVPLGDDGGALTNGGGYDGTIQAGDLDLWSFTANSGARVVLSAGTITAAGYFNPWLRIYGPDGVLIGDSGGATTQGAAQLALTTTNSGNFTVLVSDGSYVGYGGTGTYRLYYAQTSGAFIVPPGDEGGPLINGVAALGTIQPGDLDLWRFTGCRGDYVVLAANALTQTNYFNPWLRLYDLTGRLVADSGGTSPNNPAVVALTLTNSGEFTVLVSDTSYGDFDGSGDYRLTSNGLFDGLKICIPIVSGANVNLAGAGGGSNATYIFFTHTNVSAPFAQWTPIRTNQFDGNGVFSYTNVFNPAERGRYFRLESP